MRRHTNLFDGQPKNLLHFAPEPAITKALSSLRGLDYLSADLNPERAMEEADITRLPFASNRFDMIYCSHVLEHIPQDAQAMRELFRVLSPGGMAIVQVPERGEETYEDPSIVTPTGRAAAFGQWDHVRWYGSDIADRLVSAGFLVKRINALEMVEPKDRSGMGLASDLHSVYIYLCSKK